MSEYNAKTKTKKIKNSSSNRQNWKIFDEEIKKKPSIECIYDVSDNSEKTLFPTSIWATRKIPVFPRGQSKFRRTLTSHSSVAPLQQILE